MAGLVLAWVGWIVSDLLVVDIAYGETFRFRIEVVRWRDAWPVLRWLPGWLGVLVATLLVWMRRPFDRSRTGSCLVLVGFLLGLRLVSFLPGVGTVVPVLGLVWTAHASWAVSLTVLFYSTFPMLDGWLATRSRIAGWGLLVFFGILYTVFAVFFVRTTLLHGDEPQYLLITQSLLHDGDIDLSNATKESDLEFHQKTVQPRRAPASPPGRVHSAHPIGLGILLAPVYWLGLTAADHPRLACVLLVAVTSAMSVLLAFRWLIDQDVSPAGALLTSIGVGISPLMFLFSTQLYPEVFALVAALIVLTVLARPLARTRVRQSALGIVVILVALPLLHQRLLPMAVFLGLLMWLHVREIPDRVSILKSSGVILTLATAAYILYHLHFSGDIWGPFKPGNADVLDFEHLPTALVGQWLDARVGLLNNSPIFVGALVGVVAMAVSRDRRLLIVVGIYATTACVNALSNDWRFGYCFPSRFMVTALPALLIPLAYTMDRALNRSASLVFVVMCGVCVGWDSNYEALLLKEGAYDGNHLIHRALDQVYPASVHFPDLKDVAKVPWMDVACWAAAVAILGSMGRVDARKSAVLLVGLFVMVPVLTSPHHPLRLKTQSAHGLRRFSSDGSEFRVHLTERQVTFGTYNGAVQDGSGYVARRGEARTGVAGYSGLPDLYPPIYRVTLAARASASVDGQPGAYYVLVRRRGVRTQMNHQIRYAVPLTPDGSAASIQLTQTSGRGILQHFVMYREGANLSFGNATLVQHPVQLREKRQLVSTRRLDLDSRDGFGFYHGYTVVDLA